MTANPSEADPLLERLAAERRRGTPDWLISATLALLAQAERFPPRTEEELDSPVFFYPH